MLKLRPYQVEPVRKAIDFFRQDGPDPALLVLPTGAGKSIIAAEVAAACPDPILVVQPTKELLEQNLDKYRLLCGELAPAGIYSASFGKKQIDHVTFATIGSIKSIGAEFRQLGFRKMLIDEAHLYPRKEQSMLGEFLRDSGIRHVLGMTATPLKLESFSEKQGDHFDKWSELVMLTNPSPSGSFFRSILHITQVQEMTGLGYWSPLRYEVLPFDRSGLSYNTSGTEYTEDSVVSAYEANNIRANILAALAWHRERKHCIVFVPSVEEASILPALCPNSAYVCGETPKKERAEIFRAFRAGEIRVLFGVSVFGTGFDCPKIDMIILGNSMASMARYYQYCGRGVRIDPQKNDCIIVDAGGNVERFGKIEDIRYMQDGRWQMYGTDDKLITSVPIHTLGCLGREDVLRSLMSVYINERFRFGKHRDKAYRDIPISYLSWLLNNPSFNDDVVMRANICRTMLNHVRDTRNDPPATVLPDGKHAGEHLGFVPNGYLRWYYDSKEWNETNDSLRRGIELFMR